MPRISPRAHILSPFDMRPIIRCPPKPCGRSTHTVHIIVASPVKKTLSKRKPTPKRTHGNRRTPPLVKPIARKPTPKRTHGNRRRPSPVRTIARKPTPKRTHGNRRRPSPVRSISRKPTPKRTHGNRGRPSPIRPISRKPTPKRTHGNRRRKSPIRPMSRKPSPKRSHGNRRRSKIRNTGLIIEPTRIHRTTHRIKKNPKTKSASQIAIEKARRKHH